MGCNIIEKYLKENVCDDIIIPEMLQKHMAECKDCRNYHQFVATLKLQKGHLEKAPEEILPAIERKILNSVQPRYKTPFIFTSLLKPSFVGFSILLVCVFVYAYLDRINVGYVENLSERFKLAQFEKIKAGEILYAGNNTTAAISLKGNNKLQLQNNTMVKVKNKQYLSLSRGVVSIQTGDKKLLVATPEGRFLAKNTSARVQTTSRLDNGVMKTETTCLVFKGQLSIKTSVKETNLHEGQKVVIDKNGRISDPQPLALAEIASEKDIAVKHTLFAAVESLCDCAFTSDFAPGKKGDHLQLFGKEVYESKNKVRVFWQAERRNGMFSGRLSNKNENDHICSTKTRRIRA